MENIKTKWTADPTHSEIGFKVRHLMISNVKGVFSEFEASALTDGDDFSKAEISFSMNPASVNTGEPNRDNHLRSADFFDAEQYKVITFTSKRLENFDSEGNFVMVGDLNIKGIVKEVSLTVESGGLMKDPWGNIRAGFTISGKINRKDWQLNWNAALETGGVLVGEEVKISCDIELVKQA